MRYLLDTNILSEPPKPDHHPRARLCRIGKTPAFIDGQIAAVVRVNGLVLVTHNLSDFSSFDGLEVEDWAAD